MVGPYLRDDQRFVMAGCSDSAELKDKGLVVERRDGQVLSRVGDEFSCNQPEGDTRTWFHVKMCRHRNQLILVSSHDTDLVFVGLQCERIWRSPQRGGAGGERRVFLQTTKRKDGLSLPDFIDMGRMHECILNHPQLQAIPLGKRVSTIVSLYVLTGCDYVSFIHGISKSAFLNALYKNAAFISSTRNGLGTLADWEREKGPISATPPSRPEGRAVSPAVLAAQRIFLN
jgi:hypothetical protein